MSPNMDLPSPEIDIFSRRLFVNIVKDLLPAPEWHTVHQESTHFMSAAAYKVGRNVLKLELSYPVDSPSYASVTRHHPESNLEALVDRFDVNTDLSETSFLRENRKLRPAIQHARSREAFLMRMQREYEDLELRRITGADVFTEHDLESILSDLLQCSEANRLES